jgi:hypothetical protein
MGRSGHSGLGLSSPVASDPLITAFSIATPLINALTSTSRDGRTCYIGGTGHALEATLNSSVSGGQCPSKDLFWYLLVFYTVSLIHPIDHHSRSVRRLSDREEIKRTAKIPSNSILDSPYPTLMNYYRCPCPVHPLFSYLFATFSRLVLPDFVKNGCSLNTALPLSILFSLAP